MYSRHCNWFDFFTVSDSILYIIYHQCTAPFSGEFLNVQHKNQNIIWGVVQSPIVLRVPMQYYLVHGGPIINGNDNEANIGTVSAKLVFNLGGTNDLKKFGNMFFFFFKEQSNKVTKIYFSSSFIFEILFCFPGDQWTGRLELNKALLVPRDNPSWIGNRACHVTSLNQWTNPSEWET